MDRYNRKPFATLTSQHWESALALYSYETEVRISSKLKILTSATLVYTNANYTFIVVIFSCSPIQNAMTVGGCEDILLYGMTSKGSHH